MTQPAAAPETRRWTAGYLPGLAAGDVQWSVIDCGGSGGNLEVALPVLQPAQMQALAARVRQASREHLAPLPVSRIIGIVDQAVARLLDPRDSFRREAEELLPRVTGYDAEMVRLSLSSYLKTFRAPQLHRFVAEDFANPKVLDEFQPAAKGGAVRAVGPALLVHSWAGNVPGLPLWSLVCGLLVKAGNIGKLPSAEPVFASLFARLLAQVHPPLADCLAVVWWQGGDAEPAATLYREADTVLAYGSNDVVEQVRAQLPVTTRFVPFGHKVGLALVGRCALDTQRGPATARLAAHDVVRWEQQGCYSPHVVYVERGARVAPRDFAGYLAAELANLLHRFRRRALSLHERAAVARWRQQAETRALSDVGDELIGDDEAGWAVAYADRLVPLAPSAGHRCIQVVAVDALEEAIDALQPHAVFLQTVAVAVEPARLYPLAERLAGVGVTRITTPGAMASPEAGWHHDGGFNLLGLVRMVEIEQRAEHAAERLAPYADEDDR
jgi:hypothetical protein